jgi:secondary thiamine-phosphate synthase enzyme
MKSIAAQTHTVPTHQRTEMIDVTALVRDSVRESKIHDGMAIIFVPHTTAAVTINENADPDVQHDLLHKLQSLIPKNESYYQHGEGNSDSHLKTSLTGSSVIVLIEAGRLILGQWQGIFFCEFDGPRRRNLIVKLVNFSPATNSD